MIFIYPLPWPIMLFHSKQLCCLQVVTFGDGDDLQQVHAQERVRV